MNIIHEIGNEPQSGHGMQEGRTDGVKPIYPPQLYFVGGIKNANTENDAAKEEGHRVGIECTGFHILIMTSGGRLNKKDGLTRYGDSHVKDKTS